MSQATRDILINGVKAADTALITVMSDDLKAALGPAADKFIKDTKPGSAVRVNRTDVLKALESAASSAATTKGSPTE